MQYRILVALLVAGFASCIPLIKDNNKDCRDFYSEKICADYERTFDRKAKREVADDFGGPPPPPPGGIDPGTIDPGTIPPGPEGDQLIRALIEFKLRWATDSGILKGIPILGGLIDQIIRDHRQEIIQLLSMGAKGIVDIGFMLLRAQFPFLGIFG